MWHCQDRAFATLQGFFNVRETFNAVARAYGLSAERRESKCFKVITGITLKRSLNSLAECEILECRIYSLQMSLHQFAFVAHAERKRWG